MAAFVPEDPMKCILMPAGNSIIISFNSLRKSSAVESAQGLGGAGKRTGAKSSARSFTPDSVDDEQNLLFQK